METWKGGNNLELLKEEEQVDNSRTGGNSLKANSLLSSSKFERKEVKNHNFLEGNKPERQQSIQRPTLYYLRSWEEKDTEKYQKKKQISKPLRKEQTKTPI